MCVPIAMLPPSPDIFSYSPIELRELECWSRLTRVTKGIGKKIINVGRRNFKFHSEIFSDARRLFILDYHRSILTDLSWLIF